MSSTRPLLLPKDYALGSTGQLFPNTGPVAYYDTIDQTIVANKVDSASFRQLSAKPTYQLVNDVLGTLVHEFTHWLDHSSTVWGREQLRLLFDAYNARASNKESEFWRIASAMQSVRANHLPQYYSSIERTNYDPFTEGVWQWAPSCGAQFGPDGRILEDRPIVFTVFSDKHGKRVCRVPFTVASLLETNAVAAQLTFALDSLSMVDSTRQTMQSKVVTDNYYRQLYNPTYGVYSVAAHYIANRLKITDIAVAYRLATALAATCLNLTPEAFNEITVPSDVRLQWRHRVDYFLKNRDRGFAFFVLVMHAPSGHLSDTGAWLASTVATAGLPSLDVLEQRARRDVNGALSSAINGPFRTRLEEVLAVGARNFEIRGAHPSEPISLKAVQEQYEGPKVLLSDNTWKPIAKVPVEPTFQDPASWMRRAAGIYRQIAEFYETCRH